MKPEFTSKLRLATTRSSAKMYEYNVPEEHHLDIPHDPAELFSLTIGLLGDVASRINTNEPDSPAFQELKSNLNFSAQFFDAYLQSKLDNELDDYLLLLGSSAYYLCDFPGSSAVLIKKIQGNPNLEVSYLDELLKWLLQGDFSSTLTVLTDNSKYVLFINTISNYVTNFYSNGILSSQIDESVVGLRKVAYSSGTSRELLFVDIIGAIIKRRIENSTWTCLPRYTDLSIEDWRPILIKETFIKELWPAQKLLGESDIFKGESSVIQMPTSAGKTKSIEIIIRSSFLTNRANIAIIIAPFRALCHEIKNSMVTAFYGESVVVNEPSDAMQMDITPEEWIAQDDKRIIILTPEKLLYILRHSPELGASIGLIIFDEGHQFDSGTRGITYELLLASLKNMISEDIQKVLISAVISNANEIGNWLSGEDSSIVEGSTLSPTYRSIAFASWIYELGQIKYVTKSNPDIDELFVPRVIEKRSLVLRPGARIERFFPENGNSNDIALFLGIKLTKNGAVGIFCGRKDTVSNLCKRIVDVYERGFDYAKPATFSDEDETLKLSYLHQRHFGSNCHLTKGAELGVFTHTGNTPQGLRLSIEYSMEKNLVKFVICTSTLAQGVNLPLRYLLVTSVYQGRDRIKVRDFHNLLGRAGRSGMHTEGSVIFTDQKIYDDRENFRKNWRWEQAKTLLDQENSEPCDSTIISLFTPFTNERGNEKINMEPLEFIELYIAGQEELTIYIEEIINDNEARGFTRDHIMRQVTFKLNIISAIESYLMTNANNGEEELSEEEVSTLAQSTLAYYSSDEEGKQQIMELFQIIALHISENGTQPSKQLVYGKTLLGIHKAIEIEQWIHNNFINLISLPEDELQSFIWPILVENINDKLVKHCSDPSVMKELASLWINGESFQSLYSYVKSENVSYRANTQTRQYHIEHMVKICEGSFSYDTALILGAIISLLELLYGEESERLIKSIKKLQKQLKYGLNSDVSIALNELGFSDRCITQDLENAINVANPAVIKDGLINNEEAVLEILSLYPSYFSDVYRNII